jgi:hypothetical protein
MFHDYFEHINDDKFMTGQCCVQNSAKIIRYKPELRDEIIAILLDVDNRCAYTERQIGVLKSDVLDVLDEAYEDAKDREGVDAFIRASVASISPKTRRRAKQLVRKYRL